MYVPVSKTQDELEKIVKQIIDKFQSLIEDNYLWKILWTKDGRAVKEEVIQKIFFGIAVSYCDANNVDIAPEANAGPGPVDFKFSSGSDAKLLVEVKKSNNSHLVLGYTKQLEAYKTAEGTELGFYLVIDIGGSGDKFEKLLEIRNERVSNGDPVCAIIFIDGMPKPSASKLL
jgi:hypothetical protein